jgi:PKD repeat protein
VDTGTRGTTFFDAFESHRQSYIGGVLADFTVDKTSGNAPLAVQFSDLSKGGVTGYAWDFGDGATSTLASPAHTYAAAGTYTVQLTVTGGTLQHTLVKTGYITVQPYSDLIFADGFESGSLSAWSSAVTDGGDLSVADASLVGAKAMQAVMDDNAPLYAQDNHPSAEAHYRARFYFDPNSLPMANGNGQYLFAGYSGSMADVFSVHLLYSGGQYRTRASLTSDGGGYYFTPSVPLSDGPHFIEVEWQAASAPGASDGYATLWLDGVQVATRTGVDNDGLRLEQVRLGPTGVDTGTRGTTFFDEFESHRENYIGP